MSMGMVYLPHCSLCYRAFAGQFEDSLGEIQEVKDGAPAEEVLFIQEAWLGIPGQKSMYPTGLMVCTDCQEVHGLKPLAVMLRAKAKKNEEKMKEIEAEEGLFDQVAGHLDGASTMHRRSGLVGPGGGPIIQPGMPAGRIPLHEQAPRRGVESLPPASL